MSPSEPGDRRAIGAPLNVVTGLVVFVVGLWVAATSGGWAWLVPVLGIVLAVLSALSLYLDPPGGPRRRLRDLRARTARRAPRR